MYTMTRFGKYLLRTLFGAALFTIVVPATAVDTYSVIALGGQVASRLNENGDVVGWGVLDGNPRAYVYTREDGLVYLDLPAGQTHSMAEDVSDRASDGRIRIVGSAYPDIFSEPGTAYRWTYAPGIGLVGTTSLGTVGTDPYSVARGINSSGEIVGYSDPADLLSGGVNAFIYRDATGLTALGFKGAPQEINDSSQIVGYGGDVANVWRLTAGLFEDLGKPVEATMAWAYAINEAGSVAGMATLPASLQQRIARYTDTDGWQLLGGFGTTNIGWGINNDGAVVGEGVADLTGRGLRGVIHTAELGRLAYIEDFIDVGGWNIFAAYDINNQGLIAGYGFNVATDAGGGVLLVPDNPSHELPAAPSDLAGATAASGIELGWTDNSDNESGFLLERRQTGDDYFAELASTAANAYFDGAVANCSRYEYRVRAFNAIGDSDYSNSAAVDAPCVQVPLAPSNLTAENRPGEVVLSWDDNSDNEAYFEVERDAGQGFLSLDDAVSGSLYVDDAVQVCTLYIYRVRAINFAGASDYSNSLEVMTPCASGEAPVVRILEPGDGAVVSPRIVPIRANVTDDRGIINVGVYVNEKRICNRRVRKSTVILSTEVDCDWRTKKSSSGEYTIRVLALDSDGNQASEQVLVHLR